MKMLITLSMLASMVPAVLFAEPPSISLNELNPVIPGDYAIQAEQLTHRATPVLPRERKQRGKGTGNVTAEGLIVDPLHVSPTCIVIANASIGHQGLVRQTAAINTLNVNCQ